MMNEDNDCYQGRDKKRIIKKERELLSEMAKSPFDVKILFLDDFLPS